MKLPGLLNVTFRLRFSRESVPPHFVLKPLKVKIYPDSLLGDYTRVQIPTTILCSSLEAIFADYTHGHMHFSFLKQLFEIASIIFHPKTLQPESPNTWKFFYIIATAPNNTNSVSIYNSSTKSICISPIVSFVCVCVYTQNYPLHLVVRSR